MNRKKKAITLSVIIAVGFGLAMLAMSVAIYFGFTEAYATGADSLNVSLFGLNIYTLTKDGEQYAGASVGQNMGIICAGFMAVAAIIGIVPVCFLSKKNDSTKTDSSAADN